MQNKKQEPEQYFVAVPVSSENIPDKEVCAVTKSGQMMVGFITQSDENSFICKESSWTLRNVTHYLQPISLAQMDKEVAVGFSEWSAKEDYIFYAQRGSWAKRKLLHPTWFTTTELYNGPYQDYLATLPTPPTT